MKKLFKHQIEAISKMKNGCILCGDVGSGKSMTAIAYFHLGNGGVYSEDGIFEPMGDPPPDLYIITTARKRDTLEWEGELSPFLLSPNPEINLYSNKVIIDSWNNIKKYKDVENAFFIFDEQRVIGSGAWVKSYLKIAKKNNWILLSATPGDSWKDYIPVFLANGFYKNRTEFAREHIVYSRFTKFPMIDKYINTGKLIRYRNSILIEMDFKKKTEHHIIDIFTDYDVKTYKEVTKKRWDPYKNTPIINAAGLCYIWRRIVNSDESRQLKLLEIFEDHPKIIVFYNFNYELDILKNLYYGEEVEIAEWNGRNHQPIPTSDSWVYLVQYNAGSEGWNCIETDTIIFYSQNYSYRTMKQASGRIDRLNTPYKHLFYYHLKSRSGIDVAINRAIKNKKNFNESNFVKW